MKTRRVLKIKSRINKKSLDAVLISSVPNIIYLTGYNGFSTKEREAFLFITQKKQYIITDGRYTEVVYKEIPHFEMIERSIKLPIKQIFKNVALKHRVKKLGIEENNLTISELKMLNPHYNNTYHYSIDRSIKEAQEIEAIQKACKIGDNAFQHVLKKIKRGITEKQLAFELERFIKEHNADLSFRTIIAFGSNSSLPHHVTSNQKLETNTIVLMDFGVKVDNYCSDMTRTVFFGKADQKFKKIYHTVFDAQQKAIEYLSSTFNLQSSDKKTVHAFEVDKLARDYITSRGFASIPHSLGHGIGIEVHEAPILSPNSKDVLKSGMVFSIEPGIYIPRYGGVRIEDLAAIEKKSIKILTTAPKTLIEI